jgi:hypothetical protein
VTRIKTFKWSRFVTMIKMTLFQTYFFLPHPMHPLYLNDLKTWKWMFWSESRHTPLTRMPQLALGYNIFQNCFYRNLKFRSRELENKLIVISDCPICTDFLTALSLNIFFQSKWWKLSLISWNLVSMMFVFKNKIRFNFTVLLNQ